MSTGASAGARRRPRWVAGVLLAATFAAGGVAGAAAMAFAERAERAERVESRPAKHAGRSAHGRGPDAYLARLTRDLQLSPAQQESVRAVLRRHHPAMDSLMRATRPRLETLRATIRSEIATHLTPEQRQRYDELRQRKHRDDTTHAR